MAETVREKAEELGEYLGVQISLVKLKAVERSSGFAAAGVAAMILAMLASLCFLFICIAAGFYLSDYFNSYTKGFSVLALAMLVLTLVLALFRKPLLVSRLRDRLIRSLLAEQS